MTLGARAHDRLHLANRHPPAANLVISNVRGPASTVAIAGATIRRFYSVGPVLHGLGLNVTAWSYRDALGLAILGDAAGVPDPHRIAELIVEGTHDLAHRVRSPAGWATLA